MTFRDTDGTSREDEARTQQCAAIDGISYRKYPVVGVSAIAQRGHPATDDTCQPFSEVDRILGDRPGIGCAAEGTTLKARYVCVRVYQSRDRTSAVSIDYHRVQL
jgi:hypothetical protein